MKKLIISSLFGALFFLTVSSCFSQEKPQILIFTKTDGFVHQSIPAGKKALMEAAKKAGFVVDTTSDADFFREENLIQYKAIVFLNTTGNVLDSDQQEEFEKFIRAGNGYVGIHSAADTEYDWPWYGKLVGGYFQSHPEIQSATIEVIDKDHPSTQHLPEKWERRDEWYNYKNLNPEVTVLARLDEQSYKGGENGDHHPIAWYHDFDGGRAFYSGGGHTPESYQEPAFLKHLIRGILWAAGKND
ncbi:ThuA domain-containing protein [Salinimicrobium sp. HB62]|uniref:ThuA domain-containing protein n=1 Tax=Salinimicrobium sp. HB62 TaxID=3077781 RepID=UPI002D76ACCE|nr:ThuA domain-containing protein [Salinimicrobium sp. HB62]